MEPQGELQQLHHELQETQEGIKGLPLGQGLEGLPQGLKTLQQGLRALQKRFRQLHRSHEPLDPPGANLNETNNLRQIDVNVLVYYFAIQLTFFLVYYGSNELKCHMHYLYMFAASIIAGVFAAKTIIWTRTQWNIRVGKEIRRCLAVDCFLNMIGIVGLFVLVLVGALGESCTH